LASHLQVIFGRFQRAKTTIISELPKLIKKDPDIRNYIIKITRVRHADKETMDERFDRIPDELKRDREERSKRLKTEGNVAVFSRKSYSFHL